MNDIQWLILVVLAGLGYAERSLPWVLAQRWGLSPGMTRWLTYVAPAAFATLLVYDLGRLDFSTLMALVVSGLVAWKTRNLGGAVFAAMAVKMLFIVIGN